MNQALEDSLEISHILTASAVWRFSVTQLIVDLLKKPLRWVQSSGLLCKPLLQVSEPGHQLGFKNIQLTSLYPLGIVPDISSVDVKQPAGQYLLQ